MVELPTIPGDANKARAAGSNLGEDSDPISNEKYIKCYYTISSIYYGDVGITSVPMWQQPKWAAISEPSFFQKRGHSPLKSNRS